MKQILIKEGKALVEDVPAPEVELGSVLVQVMHSCISAGTEISGVRSSGEPAWKRALKHPDEVKQVLKMVSEQGVRRIHRMVKSKLSSGNAIGYSASGTVIAVGEGVEDTKVGDVVACAGAQCAHHSEVIRVPRNLIVQVPGKLSSQDASTVTLGTIALQGVRRFEPDMGEAVVVLGLGILGLITIQLLRANGCRVIGLDVDRTRIELARGMGVENAFHPDDDEVVAQVQRLTDGYGADGVVITAAGSSSEILSQSFQMCRQRGRVVLVGDVGMNIKRPDMFKKELDFRISTSYGPGRYDSTYEEGGIDYPYGYVRWTENRNMQEYLRLLENGTVSLKGIVTRVAGIDDANEAYQALKNGSDDLMVVLEYPVRSVNLVSKRRVNTNNKPVGKSISLGVIGTGSFAKGMHLPNIERMPELFRLRGVMSRTGHNAKAVADQFKAEYSTTAVAEILADKDTDAVLITTRHNQHGLQVLQALQAGKHVFVEKPLTLTADDLNAIKAFYDETPEGPILQTGFNRRFSPHVVRLREIVKNRTNPLIINYRMNAGYVSLDNWVHGSEGGGRNLGEGCHIYDLFTFLTDSKATKINAQAISPSTDYYGVNDNFVATISFEDGSVATLTYTALGAKSAPKERMDVYVDGKVIYLEDYKSLEIIGSRQKGVTTKRMQKGQEEEMRAFGEAIIAGGEWPIALWQQIQATEIALAVEEQIINVVNN